MIVPAQQLILLALAVFAGGFVLLAFFRWEQRDRPECVVACVVLALLGQIYFYSNDPDVPVGLFRPGPLRLPELLIISGLCARFLARGGSRRISIAGAMWAVFLSWYALGVVVGWLEGNNRDELLFNAKLIVYVGGLFVLVAGSPIERLLRPLRSPWLLGLASALVSVQILVTLTDTIIPVPARLGTDGASLYLGLGLCVVLVEATRRPPRWLLIGLMVPLLLGPFVVHQRASVVHAAATGVLALVAVLGSTAARQMAVTSTQLLLAVAGVAVIGVAAMIPNAADDDPLPDVVRESFDATFGGTENEQSADARVLKWEAGEEKFWERPWFGHGLGAEFVSFRPGVRGVGVFQTSGVFDNIYFDLLLRVGSVGAALFVLAMFASAIGGLRVWRTARSRPVAAVGLGSLIFLLGLATKGMVESVNDKVVLACGLGLATGVIAAARRSTSGYEDEPMELVPHRLGRATWS